MRIGFIGSGNMARAIALGLDEPASFSDSGSGRAKTLAALVGGTAAGVEEIGSSSDLIFLAHKPAQLAELAARLAEFDGIVVSMLAATPMADLHRAYPLAKVVRVMPNTPVEFACGVVALARESDNAPGLRELLDRLGTVVELPEAEFDLATAVGGCAPAFFALFAKQLVRAANQRGMPADTAALIVGQTLLGTARLLEGNAMDTDGAIAAVASPGGLTERALDSFDHSGLAAAVDGAVATVLGEQ